MIGSAVTFISYLWHYLVARMLYDQVLRPLIQGHAKGALLLCGVAIGSFALGRWNGRRGSVRADRLSRRRSA